MALFGSLFLLPGQAPAAEKFAVAFAYAGSAVRPGSEEHRRILALAPGASEKIELGGGVFAIEQVYHAKLRPECFFESHRKYIDVQVIVEGAEAMEVEDIGRLVVAQPYLEERDLVKYAEIATASRLVVRAGEAAVFFPTDGHMPCLRIASGDSATALVRKTVVKVPAG